MIGPLVNNLQADIALLQRYIERRSNVGFRDMERMLEALCIPLFRAWKHCELTNMNQIRVNYPAIDLADEAMRIAVQVTSNATTPKVKQTLRVHEQNGFQKHYEHLYILGFIKATKPLVPEYCTVLGIDTIVNDLIDRADEADVQEVVDAIKRHQSYSALHPWDDRDCLEIILNYVDRNAIKHSMGVEGSATEMVRGLNEVSELIGKGQVNRRVKSKSLDEFLDKEMKTYLRNVKDLISEIVAIVNMSRADKSDFVELGWEKAERIDTLKEEIAGTSNQIARKYDLPITITMKRRW